MKPIQVKITPDHKEYPTHSYSNERDKVVQNVYYDDTFEDHPEWGDYTITVTSDWYENDTKRIRVTEDTHHPLTLITRQGTINVTVDTAAIIQVSGG